MASKITIKATLNQNGTIACSWNSVAGVKEYVVDIKRESSRTPLYTKVTTATSCVTTDKVIQGSLYRINVWANNANRVTIGSGKLTLTVPADFYVRSLTVPTNLRAVPGTTSIQISFNSVNGATSYDILFDGRVYNTTKTNYTFTGLQPKTTYNYKICCVGAHGTGNYSTVRSITTQAQAQAPLPGVPSGITKKSTENTAAISWNPVSGASGYDLKFNGSVYSQTGTSRTISGLKANTGYKFQVRAKNTSGAGAYSPEQSVTTTPAKPSGITKKSTANSVTVSWNQVSGATGYDLLFNGKAYSQTGTSRTMSGLNPNTGCKFQVRSKSASGVSAYSPEQTVTTAPAVPTGAAQTTHDTATISWNAVPGASGYDLKFNGSEYSVPSGQTSRKMTGLKPKTDYRYQIRAKNADGTGAYSPEKTVRTQAKKPDMPANITSVNTENSVEIKWDRAGDASSYDVMFNGSAANVTGTSRKYNGLKANTKYPYKVRSKNADGVSEYSPEKTAQTAPKTPTGVKAVTDEDSASLSWDKSDGATGYEVDADGMKYSTSNNSAKVSGLIPDTDHSFKVSAKNAGGTSTPSASKKARTTPKAPASPSASATKSSVTVSWPSVSGATSYDVQFDGKKYNTCKTSQYIGSLTPGTNHTYAVSCRNADGASRYSPSKSIATLPNAPERPSDVSATATKNSVTVSWPAVSGASDYDLVFNGTAHKVAGTSKTITGLQENTRYSYKVRANNAGGSSAYTWDRYITTLMTPPAVPTNVRASVTHDTATISWSPAARATSYQLVFNNANYTTQSTSCTVRGLKPNTSYSYKVCAVSSGGSSAYAPAGTVRTLVAPTNVTADAAKDKATVKWNPVSGAAGYDLLFDGTLYNTTEPTKTVTGLKPGRTIHIRSGQKMQGVPAAIVQNRQSILPISGRTPMSRRPGRREDIPTESGSTQSLIP